MRQLLTLLSCLFFGLNIFAQSTLNPPHLQCGVFAGMGRTSYKDNSYIGRLGTDLGFAFIRKHRKRNRRLEVDLSCSHWNFRSDKVYSSYKPLSDTFTIGYRKVWFFDAALKTNIQLFAGEKVRIYLVGGITFGTFIDSRRRAERYLTATDEQLTTGEWIKSTPLTRTMIGLEYGLLAEFPLRNNWTISVEPLILSKVTFEYEPSYPYKFQQLRIGLRKSFY